MAGNTAQNRQPRRAFLGFVSTSSVAVLDAAGGDASEMGSCMVVVAYHSSLFAIFKGKLASNLGLGRVM